ncbi:uncharacterized protein [Dysidea avara]|uniref:uncharacterized protein n=1 Tax=Dysidea avara TaxID=196820 RepID=UPI00332240DA
MMLRIWPAFVLLMLMSCTLLGASTKLITVDSDNGEDDDWCINSGTYKDGSHPCKTLYQALNGIANNTLVHIVEGIYPHNTTDTTLAISNISITGNGANVTVIQCDYNSGFGFVNATSVSISGLTVLGCGQLRDSTAPNISSQSTILFRAALYYLNVEDVSIDDVIVSNSTGMGVAMYDVTGSVSVTNSTFSNNKVPEHELLLYPGGGGFSVEFTYCKPGELDPCSVSSINNSLFFFDNCTFAFNNATTSDNIKYINSVKGFGNPKFGHGGGLSVFFKGRAFSNKVVVTGSRFISNYAKWGGGYHSDFVDSSGNNSLNIHDSNFTNNHCYYDNSIYGIGAGGGGARISLFYFNETHGHNQVVFSHCVFTNNSAYYGGGMSFSTTKEQIASNTLQFVECSWHGNIARSGSGVDLTVLTLPIGVISAVKFNNCIFRENSNNYVNRSILLLGIGSLYADSVPIEITGNCSFEDNQGSALVGTASRIAILSGSRVSFINNTGHHGAAISLLGNAYLHIYNGTRLYFTANTAFSKGGAIYSLSPSERDFISTKKCFLYYYDPIVAPPDWNTSFIFKANKAVDGKSIFCTSLFPCIWNGLAGKGNSKNVSDVYDVFKWNGTFKYDDNDELGNQISTDPINIKGYIVNDFIKALSIQPGQRYDLNMTPLNDIDKQSPAVFFVRSSNTTTSVVDDTFTYTSRGLVQLYGEPGSTVNLELQTVGVRPLSVTFNVTFVNCPPGFYIENKGNESVCRCSSYIKQRRYRGVVICDDNQDELVAYLRSQYWAGYQIVNHKAVLITGECPENYCYTNYSKLIRLPSSTSLDRLLCGAKHRTGRLCGECMDGYHIYVNSPTFDCGKCDDSLSKHGVLYLLLLKYFPMTIFLCFILYFNISLVNGPLNGFILFSQIIFAMGINASGAIGKPSSGKWLAEHLVQCYTFLYGIWNLDFFETLVDPFCCVKDKSALSVLLLHYASACFPLVLFVLFFNIVPWMFDQFSMSRITCVQSCALKFQRVCIRFRSRWSVQNSVVHGLTTLLVLSYAKITSLTWYILTYGVLSGPGGEDSSVIVRVAWVDGTKPYLSGVHGIYAIVAFVFLFCFVLFAPILMLLYPYLPRLINRLNWEEKRIVKLLLTPLHHAVPFFDVIQGCFKDECRFFAAFYFSYRVIILAMYSFTGTVALHYLWQIGFYTTILLMHCLFQPYKERWHNCIDAFILALLPIISAISFYRYYEYLASLSPSPWSFWIQLFTIYLPLWYFVFYVTKRWWNWCCLSARILSRCKGRNGFQKIDSSNESSVDFPARLLHSLLTSSTNEPKENVELTVSANSVPLVGVVNNYISTIQTYETASTS